MKDDNKTKEQLLNELVEMRQRIAELEASETERKRAEDLLRIQRDLGIALSSTSNLTEALDRLLEATFRIEAIDCGGVYLIDAKAYQRLERELGIGAGGQNWEAVVGPDIEPAPDRPGSYIIYFYDRARVEAQNDLLEAWLWNHLPVPVAARLSRLRQNWKEG